MVKLRTKKVRNFMQLGDRLRNAREERDLKQTDVARQTGISNKVLSSYERNISLPTIDNLLLLCECYQISSDELLGINLPTENSEKNPVSKFAPIKLSDEQKRILFYYQRLNEENRDAIKGLMVTYYKEQEKSTKK